MRPELVSIAVLVLMFVIATILPVNLGALALVGAYLVGTLAVGLSVDEIILGVPGDGEVNGGFPGDLFLLLVGLTYLFALAQNNGTIELVVHATMRLVRGRLAAAPWIFFSLSAVCRRWARCSPSRSWRRWPCRSPAATGWACC